MYLPSSTETIRIEVPRFVQYQVSQGIFPTKTMIYEFIRSKQEREPYLFGKSKIESTQGTLRSFISQVCNSKVDREMKTLYSFNSDGVDYFYTDISDVFKLALASSGISISDENSEEKYRIHCNLQYELAKMFIDAGYKVWVSSTDVNGKKNMTKYGKTIGDAFGEKLVSLSSDNVCYWIDVVVFNDDNKPIYLFEIEESTQVLKGLERMMDVKRKFKSVQCFVSSTKTEYEKVFHNYSANTYKDLECKFLNPKKIEKYFSTFENLDLTTFNVEERKNFLTEKFNEN